MPNNWKTYKLKDVAVLSTGFAFKSKFYEEKGTLKVIRGKNVTEGYLRWGGDARFWNHEVEEKLKKHLLKLDDIVIGMDGSKVGKNRAIVREHDLPAILAQRVARVQNIDKLTDQKYLWQIVKSIPFERYVDNIKTGTSIPHISLGQIGDLELNLPPLKIQKQIASILSALDDKIELNLQMNKTLEDMSMALYKHWFVDFGPFQNGEFVDSELGKIPKGWEVKNLNEVAQVSSSKRIFRKEYVEEGIPFYRGKEVIQLSKGTEISLELYITEDRFNEIEMKFGAPVKGDILISSVGTIGVSWMVDNDKPFYFKDGNLTWIKKYSEQVTPTLIHEWLKSKETQNQIKSSTIGSTQQALTISALRELKLALPSKNIEIIKSVSHQLNIWKNMTNSIKKEVSILTKTRDTLLPKLISGEVQVKDVEQLLN